jgi:hypothetical protein
LLTLAYRRMTLGMMQFMGIQLVGLLILVLLPSLVLFLPAILQN